MADPKPMSDAADETVWLDDDPEFIETLARQAKLEDETIGEFVEKSVRQRADSES